MGHAKRVLSSHFPWNQHRSNLSTLSLVVPKRARSRSSSSVRPRISMSSLADSHSGDSSWCTQNHLPLIFRLNLQSTSFRGHEKRVSSHFPRNQHRSNLSTLSLVVPKRARSRSSSSSVRPRILMSSLADSHSLDCSWCTQNHLPLIFRLNLQDASFRGHAKRVLSSHFPWNQHRSNLSTLSLVVPKRARSRSSSSVRPRILISSLADSHSLD